ncbi:MAG TPA: RNA-binding S4 domain-containing protein [Rhodospirillales bacterium]|nr:RNA-binding S4 domain-containing protein [Rhodospirillales bacterium]
MSVLRIDKWLWYARFFKSRTLAGKLCGSNKLRLNSQLIGKPHATLKVGDVLTFPKEKEIRVIKVLTLGTRRGPASEAITLYEDLEPPVRRSRAEAAKTPMAGSREPGSGRPTKADRRAIDKLQNPET